MWLSWKSWVGFWIVPMSVSHLTGITTIGLDHVALLGDTLEAIAERKAGIIKQGIPLVTGRIAPEALAVIDHIAEGKRCAETCLRDRLSGQPSKSVVTGEVFDYTSSRRQGLSRQACLVCTR